MDAFVIYLIQSALCLAALYLIYWFFLRKDTFFTANRFYLIGSIILSFILPMFKVPVFYENPEVVYVVALESITVTAQKIETGVAQNLNLYQTISIIYFTGASIFLLRFVFQLLQLAYFIRKYGVTKSHGLSIVKINTKYSPFSYFNFIFLNEQNLKDKNLDSILAHEKIHISQRHSLDVIILELLTIVQWFNPFMWLCKISLKGIHEYLADEGILSRGMNKISYQHLLLNQAVGLQLNDLTNNFNQSLIKKRFIMMTKMQSKKFARLKFLLAVPVMAILITVFVVSCQQKQAIEEPAKIIEPANAVVEEQGLKTTEQQEQVFMVVEEMPKFAGGDQARMEYIARNIKYPTEARKAGIQGRVYVSFVVEKDGSVSDIKILRGIGGGCDEEAVRIVNAMPKWEPGKQRGQAVRVQFNLPIRFVLDDGGGISKKEGESEKGEVVVMAYSSDKKNTMLVDEKVFVAVEEMPEFNTNDMSLNEFIAANLKYPEKAQNENIQGTVFVTFVVKKDGSVDNVRILRGIGGGCDEEAMRVVKMMKYKPGKQRGKTVDVQYNLPINFTMQ